MNWYLDVWKNYAVFEGRATRQAYWMFILINFIVSTILQVIDARTGHLILGSVYSLAVLVPGLAVGARRLHDIGKSGWWQLIVLVPLIGWIWLIVLLATPTKAGAQQQ